MNSRKPKQSNQRLTKKATGKASQRRALRDVMTEIGFIQYHWNCIHQSMMFMFGMMNKLDDKTACAMWHSITSDRVQRNILLTNIKFQSESDAKKHLEKIIKWMDGKGSELRNAAAHAALRFVKDDDGFELRADKEWGSKYSKLLAEKPNLLPSLKEIHLGFEELSTHVARIHKKIAKPRTRLPRLPSFPGVN